MVMMKTQLVLQQLAVVVVEEEPPEAVEVEKLQDLKVE